MNSGIRVVRGVPCGAGFSERYSVTLVRDVMVPMRDGVQLAMDLIRPIGAKPSPVVLMRTPYNKSPSLRSPFLERLARSGYIVAIQDCRGRFNSDGVFDPYRQEHHDGFDTIEWIAEQPWCDGNVGMLGGSYNGQTQWYAASQAPSALKAIVPSVSPPGNPFLNEPFYGGIMLMACPEWMVAMGRRCEHVAGMPGLYSEAQGYLEALPLSGVAGKAGTRIPWWEEWLRHPIYDEYWQSHAYEQFWPRIEIPALNITGWWDMNFLGAPRNFLGMRNHGATVPSRDGQRLVIGPWPHWVNRQRSLNGVDFGPAAITDIDGYTQRFFDHWLRNMEEEFDGEACVHVFVTGANEWWQAEEWPLPGTVSTEFFLHSDGGANSHRGNGTLSRKHPGSESPDHYLSDPFDPVRVPWSLHDGPVDDRAATARDDVLCYTSDVLIRPMNVVGPIKAILFASSSASDCDWHVRLVDVHPDGSARFLCHGALRARFRNGYGHVEFLKSGNVERFEIDMTAVGIRFLPGHRIRVEISSSWFPRFERNPQTGAENWMTDNQKPVTAKQTILHDADHPSCVRLPLILVDPAPIGRSAGESLRG